VCHCYWFFFYGTLHIWARIDVYFSNIKKNQTLSNDWPTYCHTGIYRWFFFVKLCDYISFLYGDIVQWPVLKISDFAVSFLLENNNNYYFPVSSRLNKYICRPHLLQFNSKFYLKSISITGKHITTQALMSFSNRLHTKYIQNTYIHSTIMHKHTNLIKNNASELWTSIH
jgi:hypothetical protein